MEANLNHKSLRKQTNATAAGSFDEIPLKQGGTKGNGQESSMVSDTGNIVDTNDGNKGNGNVEGNMEDSFQRLYSKELDLDEDEVPIILHELNDSAIHFISRDQYERALSLLQKAQTLIDRLQFQKNPADRLMVYLTMHNMALCFQKLGALEECALCLEASLQTLNSPFLNLKLNQDPNAVTDPSKKLKRLKYECKTHMQVCALLSQLHRHKEALIHAERSVQIAQYMIEDMLQMCQLYYHKVLVAKRNEQIAQDLIQNNEDNDRLIKDLIYYDDSVSMLERTAFRVFPIIQECASKLISLNTYNSETLYSRSGDQQFQTIGLNQTKPRVNMKAVLGYLNQSEWLYLLNIGNIMQITPMTVHDLYTNTAYEVELTRDAILEKISFLAVSYFCISTELRFLFQMKNAEDGVDPKIRKRESEFWHAKALDVAISFLPSECPLVTHILTSYQKHHAPVQQEIPEDAETNHGIKIIRPMPGIDICKFQPIVRQDPSLAVQIAPLPLSPNNYQYISSIRREGFFPIPAQKQSNNQQQNDSVATNSNNFNNNNNGGPPNNNQNLLQVSVTVNQSNAALRKSSSTHQHNAQDQPFTNRFKVSQDFQEEIGNQQQQQMLQLSGLEDQHLFDDEYEEENNPLLTEQNNSIAMQQPTAAQFAQKGIVNVQHQMINEDSSSVHSQEEPAPADCSVSEIEDETANNRYFEVDNNTSKEISLIFERNAAKKQQKTLEGSKKRQQQHKHVEMVNRTFEEEESIDDRAGKWVNNQKNHNLSIEEKMNVKRPKTSQGMRTSGTGTQKAKSTSLQQNQSLKQTAKGINNPQQQTQQLQKNSASMERIVSPNQDQLRPSGRPHHQSMITHHSVSSTKIIKPTSTQTNFHSNKHQQRTPIKQGQSVPRDGSTGRGGTAVNTTTSQVIQAATQMIMMMNASNGYNSRTAQQQERIDSTNQMKTNQSSQSDIATIHKQQRSTRSGGGGQTKANNNNNRESTPTPLQQNPTPISKRLSTNPSSTNITSVRQAPKIKKSELQAVIMNMGEPGQSKSQTRRYVQDQLEMLIKKKGFQVVDQQKASQVIQQQHSFDNGLSQSIVEKNRNSSNLRSKSRGKVAGTTSRSKERMKLRSTDNNQMVQNSTMLEELQKQILIRAAQNRKGGSNVIQIKKSTQNPELISYNSQQIPQQQWFSSGTLHQQPPQQQQTQQQSTHSAIKKFLQDRQSQNNNNNTSFDSYNLNQSTGNILNPQQQQQQTAISNYKMQLSRKILQQQQKLIGVGAIQQAQFAGPNSNFLAKNQEVHPLAAIFGAGHVIKRSATPMVEMHDMPPPQAISSKSKNITNSIPSLRLQALLNNQNFIQNPQQQQPDNQGLMYLQPSQKATPDPSMHDVMNRDESLIKSAKKKILAKKSTPKNTASIMPSNSQQYLTSHQNIHM